MGMSIGVDKSVYDWIAANAPEYLGEDYYSGEDGGYYWFYELPDTLAFDENTGAVYNINLRPSEKGYLIGNLAS